MLELNGPLPTVLPDQVLRAPMKQVTHPAVRMRTKGAERACGLARDARRMLRNLVRLCLGAAFVTACGGIDEAAVTQRAQAALKPLKQELRKALTEAMARGPEAAVDVCAVEAPAIARRAARDGVVVGRTALKLRNPLNAPPTWAVGALAGLDSARVFDLGEGRAGYLEPIRLEALCTTCHGAAVEPALRQRITALYPADQATGFSTGDLRGAFWAELAPDR